MPLFGQPVVAYSPITDTTLQNFTIAAANVDSTLLAPGTRKGFVVKNNSEVAITVLFGLRDPDLNAMVELYRIILQPDDVYLYDVPEVFPYVGRSETGGSLQIYELS